MLVGAGAALGVVLSSHSNNALPRSGATAGTSSGTGATPNPGAGPGSLGSQPPGGPPSVFPAIPPGLPAIIALQPFGDPNTEFVVHGANWPPGSRMLVSLAGNRTSPVPVFADRAGTFNYTFDQGHVFFAGRLPLGLYRVIVTGPGGRRATGGFRVNAPLTPGAGPSGAPPSPGGSVPGSSPA